MVDNSPYESSTLTGKLLPSPFYVLRGAMFLRTHRVLWKYAAAPLAIGAVILGASYGLLYYLFTRFVTQYSGGDLYWRVAYYFVVAVVTVLLVVLFFFLFTRIASAIAAPFNDLISQKTEELVTGIFTDTPFSVIRLFKDSIRILYHLLIILILYLGLLVAALVLLLIPGKLLYHLIDLLFVTTDFGEEWYWRALEYFILVIVIVVLVASLFFLFTRIASSLAPFNDLISQKTEELVTDTFTDTPFSVIRLFKDSLRSVYHSLRILALYLGLLLVALLLLLIPGIGSLLFTITGMFLSAFMLAWEYLNYPLDRRRLSWTEKSAFFRSCFRSVIGFGLGSVAVATIPFVNLLFIPAAAVGGTLLYLDLERGGKPPA
jgi:CysZ protein